MLGLSDDFGNANWIFMIALASAAVSKEDRIAIRRMKLLREIDLIRQI